MLACERISRKTHFGHVPHIFGQNFLTTMKAARTAILFKFFKDFEGTLGARFDSSTL